MKGVVVAAVAFGLLFLPRAAFAQG